MHFITERENPARILAAFRDALPEGSYLALSHATADFRPVAARHAAAVYDQATSPVTLRTRAQVAALFEGWDMVEPGVVQVPLWRPDGRQPRPKELEKIWVYGGVGRKSPDGTGQGHRPAPPSAERQPATRPHHDSHHPERGGAAAPAHPSPPTGEDARQTRNTTAEPRPQVPPGTIPPSAKTQSRTTGRHVLPMTPPPGCGASPPDPAKRRGRQRATTARPRPAPSRQCGQPGPGKTVQPGGNGLAAELLDLLAQPACLR